MINGAFRIELVGRGGLRETSGAVGANLSGVVGAENEWLCVVIGAMERDKVFGEKLGVIETAGTDMAGNGGQRNYSNVFSDKSGEDGVHKFSERVREGADGLVLVAVDNVVQEPSAFADSEGGW